LGIKPDEFNLAIEVVAGSGKDLGQDLRVEEEGGPYIETESLRLND
jgi:hypothetical protein